VTFVEFDPLFTRFCFITFANVGLCQYIINNRSVIIEKYRDHIFEVKRDAILLQVKKDENSNHFDFKSFVEQTESSTSKLYSNNRKISVSTFYPVLYVTIPFTLYCFWWMISPVFNSVVDVKLTHRVDDLYKILSAYGYICVGMLLNFHILHKATNYNKEIEKEMKNIYDNTKKVFDQMF